MRHKFGSLLILLISFCGGSEISNNEALISSTTTTVTDSITTTVTDSTTTTQPQDTNGEVTNLNFSLSFQINVNQRNANCKIREYVQSIDIPVKQYFEEIGWDKPKDIEEAEICFLFSNDISDEFIKHHNELHNILFDYLGAYDRYVHYVYSKSEEDNTDALKILNKLGVYGSTANTVDDF